MDHSPSNDRGLTFLGFLIVAGVFGFFVLLILKIGPIYLDHYKVKASLASLRSDPDLASRTKNEILISLEKHWEIDMIDSVSRDNVEVIKDMHKMKVQITYDVIQPIVGNVDVLVHFDDAIEVGGN